MVLSVSLGYGDGVCGVWGRSCASGFPFRVPYMEFCQTYHMLADPHGTLGPWADSARGTRPKFLSDNTIWIQVAKNIVETASRTTPAIAGVKFGYTKAFYKGSQDRELEVRACVHR